MASGLLYGAGIAPLRRRGPSHIGLAEQGRLLAAIEAGRPDPALRAILDREADYRRFPELSALIEALVDAQLPDNLLPEGVISREDLIEGFRFELKEYRKMPDLVITAAVTVCDRLVETDAETRHARLDHLAKAIRKGPRALDERLLGIVLEQLGESDHSLGHFDVISSSLARDIYEQGALRPRLEVIRRTLREIGQEDLDRGEKESAWIDEGFPSDTEVSKIISEGSVAFKVAIKMALKEGRRPGHGMIENTGHRAGEAMYKKAAALFAGLSGINGRSPGAKNIQAALYSNSEEREEIVRILSR